MMIEMIDNGGGERKSETTEHEGERPRAASVLGSSVLGSSGHETDVDTRKKKNQG